MNLNHEMFDQLNRIARSAGEKIMEVYQRPGDLSVETKSDESPLTEADLASHKVIAQGLAALTPDIPVLSEEGDEIPFAERQAWPIYWIIDPLDGTKEFIKRNGEFTVNIALVKNNVPVAGIVYVPAKDILYYGSTDLGAFVEKNNQVSQIKTRSLEEVKSKQLPVVVVASRSHGAEAVEKLISNIQSELGNCDTTNMGSSLKICLVAEGEADLYPRLALTSEWDTAAAHAILSAAGGSIVKPDLSPLDYNMKESILNPFFFAIGDDISVWRKFLEGAAE